MKAPVLVLLVLACALPLRADILVNGNFADGRAHWKGDPQNLDTSGNLSNASAQGGVTIMLKKDKWSKIYQTFTTREKKLRYSFTFTLSSDYQVDHDGQTSLPNFSQVLGLDDIPGVPVYFEDRNGSWMLIFAQAGRGSRSLILKPDVNKMDAQTFTGVLRGTGDDLTQMNLVFAFPPGEGTITITNISLTPDDQ